jgi:ribosomal protein S27E
VPESRNTPMTFSREEIRQIRSLMNTPDARVACPLCGETLVIVGPIVCDNSLGPTLEVMCEPCHRTTIVTDSPGAHGPEAES